MTRIITELCVQQDVTLAAALDRLNQSGRALTLFVVDDNGKLVGSLTDGDVRRGLLQGTEISAGIGSVMNRTPRSVRINDVGPHLFKQHIADDIRAIPALNGDGTIEEIIDLTERQDRLPLHAVLMAGGMGTRLRPLTTSLPKPLIPVGGKPIIEHTLALLAKYGVTRVTISVNYLKEMLQKHLGDGSQLGLEIDYLVEDEPKGTAGALSLLHEAQYDHLLVMNSDLLTTIDLSAMMALHLQQHASMTIATTSYQVSVPYAVVECDALNVRTINEKPTYTFPCNAGIYMLSKPVLELVPSQGAFHATDLIERLLADKKPVVMHDVQGYWLDIGQHKDLEKANQDIQHF